MNMIKAKYYFGYATARIATPLLRATGFRFSRAWRGQWFINHVEANLLADGIEPTPVKFA